MKTRIGIIAVMAILGMLLLSLTAAGTTVTQDVEIRGEIFTGDAEYNYANGAFFWYDIGKNHTSETMTINCSGTDNRTIAEGALVYTCNPVPVSYKNGDLNVKYGKYMLMGFMANKFVCYDNKTNELVKLLLNWGDSDDMVLEMKDSLDMPEGYKLVVQEIDLSGDKCVVILSKDGSEIDKSVVSGGTTYIYEDDNDAEDDYVPLFSCRIDSVFRGTSSNLVVIKYVFLRSDEILDIDGGDSFGVMEVKSTSSAAIILKNDETLTLDRDSEVDVMGDLYFKVADSDTLRYYLAKTISLECDPCPEFPEMEPCPIQTPCPPCINVTPPEIVEAIPDAEPEDKPTAVPTKKTLPGFEAIFALAGLLAVAYLVLRQRE